MRLRGRTSVAAALLALYAWGSAAAQAPPDTVRLTWTAPGDDGAVGTATAYSLRMSLAPITPVTWDTATVLTGVPAPLPAGSVQSVVARGLSNGTVYYFAVRTVDDAGNWSDLSNVLRWDWVIDAAPPLAPSGVSAGLQGSDVRVVWNPNSEPDLSGYSVYRSTSPASGFTRVTASLLVPAQFTDTNVPGGVDRVYYQVTATDQSGNESARSSTVTALLTAGGAWSVEAPYPNPSSGPVTFPVFVPGSGGAGAQLALLDAAGRTVRTLDLGAYAAGSQLVVWDGRNEAGQLTAPGAYRGRLKARDTIRWVRVVRVP